MTSVFGGDTADFADNLEEVLNARTGEGFSLSHMFQYNTTDMVLIHQKATLADGSLLLDEESEIKH